MTTNLIKLVHKETGEVMALTNSHVAKLDQWSINLLSECGYDVSAIKLKE